MKSISILSLLLMIISPSGYGGQNGEQGLPESYIEFERYAEDLVAPLVPLLEAGKSTIPIAGPASDHGEMADLLESVARPGLLLALWLQMEPLEDGERSHDFSRESVASWFRDALVLGTDPESPEYWGHLLNYHQHGVEMAIMTMSLTVARDRIWEPLTDAEKDQVAEWFGQIRGNARYWNNHLYFSILTLEWLRAEGYGEPDRSTSWSRCWMGRRMVQGRDQ